MDLFFRIKRHEREFNRYVDNLKITTDGEKFILYNLLSMNWSRQIVLLSIDKIKLNDINLVDLKFRTNSSIYDFSLSHIGTADFGTDDINEQQNIVSKDFYSKIRS